MNRYYIKKNISEDIKNLRFMILMLMSVAVCVFTMLLSYGIIRDYDISRNQESENGFCVRLTEAKNPDEVLNSLKKCYRIFERKAESEYITFSFDRENTEPMFITCEFKYENGKFKPDYLRRKAEFSNGRDFTDKEYASSEQIAVLNDTIDREEVLINGDVFKVIGHLKTPGNVIESAEMGFSVFVPPASLGDRSVSSFGISLWLVPSKAEKEKLEKILSQDFGNGWSLGYDEKDDGIMGASSKAGFAAAIALGVISAVNTLIMFRLILKKREQFFYCLRVCGAKKKDIRRIFLGEIFVFTVSAAVVVTAIFAFIAAKKLSKYYLYFPDIYNVKVYIILMCLYVAASMLICSLVLYGKINRIRSRAND